MNAEEQRRAVIEAIAGCERLVDQITDSRRRVATLFPLSTAGLEALDGDGWDAIYAFQMKFLLLQELASRRLLRGYLALSGDDPRNFSFREAVDRAARLRAIADADQWLAPTSIRNMLAHDYRSISRSSPHGSKMLGSATTSFSTMSAASSPR